MVWTSQTFDVEKIRTERRRLFEHIGQLVVTCAAIDQRLLELATTIGMTVVPRRYSERVAAVRKWLPDWPDSQLLRTRLKGIGDYRDGLVHSALATRMSPLTGEVRHGGVREKNALRFEQHELERLPEWESRAEVMESVLVALVWKVEAGQLEEWRLRAIALDFFTTPDTEVTAAINYLFPE